MSNFFAQVQFDAKASKTSLGLNERLRIDFTMNVDGDNFVPPSFEGFRLLAGPSQQVSQSWVNGKSSFNKTYSYFLLPTQKGTISIKQASIEYNGQVYKTTPISIKVTDAVRNRVIQTIIPYRLMMRCIWWLRLAKPIHI
ncbi:BatD family protein [Flavobacterium piscinae]|uniref:BatD family protein n=1 Tax=Flavobacterium piscinae TaxID=2506424 RepID=UPI002AAAEBF2|nr:BatD family protein [Flavobacterium piscinae]